MRGALHDERALSPRAPGRARRPDRQPGDRQTRWRPRPSTSSSSTAAARTSLHLFEHVHGDSRDRGPAMIDLAQTYEQGRPVPGAEANCPTTCRWCWSTRRPSRRARRAPSSRDGAHPATSSSAPCCKREQPYASVLGALLELAGEQGAGRQVPATSRSTRPGPSPPAFDGCSHAGPGQPTAATDPFRPPHLHPRSAHMEHPEAYASCTTSSSTSTRTSAWRSS
jgi:hypothetical protein